MAKLLVVSGTSPAPSSNVDVDLAVGHLWATAGHSHWIFQIFSTSWGLGWLQSLCLQVQVKGEPKFNDAVDVYQLVIPYIAMLKKLLKNHWNETSQQLMCRAQGN